MNENQRDTEHRPDEGKQVQQELERQLREFGDTMSDAFRHGFEGRGEEIGDRVWDVGRAAVDAANYGINAAGRAVREGQKACQRQAEKAAQAAGGSGSAWARQFFARKPEPTPVENIRASAKKRHNAGVALLAVGITFAVIFGISAISCFGAAAMFAPSTLLGDAVATEGDAITQVFVAGGRGDWQLCHGRDPGQRLGIHSHHRIVRLDDGSRCFPDACWQKAEPLRRHGRRV